MQERPQFLTYGVEEEFLWLDPQQKQGKTPPFEALCKPTLPFTLGREAHACVVEAISPICDGYPSLASHIRQSRQWLSEEAERDNAVLFAGGTHPDLNWQKEPTTLLPYYQSIIADLGAVVRSNLIFGQHVHVGNLTDENLVNTFNKLRAYLPVLCAMAANSTHWRGEHTGIECFRQCVFSKMPRTGIPPRVNDLSELVHQSDLMIKLGFIKSPTQFWYDARIHPRYKTIEIRVMDMQHSSDLAVAVALTAAMLCTSLAHGEDVFEHWDLPDWMININRWQAIKHGRQAMFVNSQGEKVAAATLFTHLLDNTAQQLAFIDNAAYQAIKTHLLTSSQSTVTRYAI